MIVPLSTSSSEARGDALSPPVTDFPAGASTSLAAADRLPKGIGRAAFAGLLGAVIVFAALECACRALGMGPFRQDDPRLWAKVRDGMRHDDPAQIALVGSSRMYLDFDLHEFSSEMGGAPVAQLAVAGSDGLLMFEELSRDVHFRGLAVFDLVPWCLFVEGGDHHYISADFLAYYTHRPWAAPIETRLRTAAQLTFAAPQTTYSGVEQALRERGVRKPSAYRSDPDRGASVDWSRLSEVQLKVPLGHLMTPGVAASPMHVRENFDALELMIRRIESRGGRVVLITLPSTGVVGEAERAAVPREKYWDVLASTTSAVTFNWMDDPRLRKFKCPDGSHLDVRDQVEFTRIVVEDLREKLRKQHAASIANPKAPD